MSAPKLVALLTSLTLDETMTPNSTLMIVAAGIPRKSITAIV